MGLFDDLVLRQVRKQLEKLLKKEIKKILGKNVLPGVGRSFSLPDIRTKLLGGYWEFKIQARRVE